MTFGNEQPKSRLLNKELGISLYVNSIFPTIQGEGIFVGMPATFVRLAGCNLQCPMCDTEYTRSKIWHYVDLVAEIQKNLSPARFVVITGGEPLRQNLEPLLGLLAVANIQVQIETNGTLPPPIDLHGATIICSPKTGTLHNKLLPHIAAYKYVVRDGFVSPDDGLPAFALAHPAAPRVARPHAGFDGPVYIQPADETIYYGKSEQTDKANRCNLRQAKASSLKYGYLLGVQMHKIIGVE